MDPHGSLPILDELPPPPPGELQLVEDRSPAEDGFLRRKSRVFRVHAGDGRWSAPFVYDEVDRKALDAVVIVPHFTRARAGGTKVGIRERYVILRSAHRPPVLLRDAARSPFPEPAERALWEVPAGLVEAEEASPEGLIEAARRELLEETGFAVAPEAVRELGPSAFPCPGVIAERHFYFHVEVDPGARRAAELDGSALEAIGTLAAVPLTVALTAARAGRLADAKTELALRRLAEELA